MLNVSSQYKDIQRSDAYILKDHGMIVAASNSMALEDEGTRILQSVSKHTQKSAASHCSRLKS
jgi:hypothetical protein